MENEFPPNSHSNKEIRVSRAAERIPEKKEVKQVTRNKATLRKKPLRKKFLEAFRPEDNKGFIEYMLVDILAFGIRDALVESAHYSIDNAFGSFGGGGYRQSRRRRGDGGYTSYNRMGTSRRRDREERDSRSSRRETRMADDTREIILDTRVEADEVLDNLFELISKYDVATMRDLLSLIGEPHNPTHEDWGWMDLRGSRIHRVRNGYLLDLPRPEPLD